jgi:hypothetical protein
MLNLYGQTPQDKTVSWHQLKVDLAPVTSPLKAVSSEDSQTSDTGGSVQVVPPYGWLFVLQHVRGSVWPQVSAEVA